MQWSRIQVELHISSAVSDTRLGVGESGLDATADQMHDDFIDSIPHLDEVREEHQSVISDLSQAIETSRSVSRDPQPLGEILSELGGTVGEGGITIPLPSALPEKLVIETMTESGGELVRLIAPERFGGIIRHFSLTNGDSITGARWSDGELKLELN